MGYANIGSNTKVNKAKYTKPSLKAFFVKCKIRINVNAKNGATVITLINFATFFINLSPLIFDYTLKQVKYLSTSIFGKYTIDFKKI
jgi:hypothetical protein